VSDVELTVAGLEVQGLRIERAHVTLPEVRLPWALGADDPGTGARLDLEVEQDDLQAWLRDEVAMGLPVVLGLAPGRVTLGVAGVGPSVTLRVDVVDGLATVRPDAGDDAWWRSLGLATELSLPDGITLVRVRVAEGRVLAKVEVDELPGLTDRGLCDGPLADELLSSPAPSPTGTATVRPRA